MATLAKLSMNSNQALKPTAQTVLFFMSVLASVPEELPLALPLESWMSLCLVRSHDALVGSDIWLSVFFVIGLTATFCTDCGLSLSR